MPSSRLRIGIVGGSIAGCTAAAELSRVGHEVSVFERSKGELVGRGAGIGTPTPLFDKLVERDLVDRSMPRFNASYHPLVGRSEDKPGLGYVALKLDLDMVLCNWGDLHKNLRKRVPDDLYHHGVSVADVEFLPEEDDAVALTLSDASRHVFDLVIFADGYQSLGRRVLFPTVVRHYRGYVLWRGLLNESEIDDPSPLESNLFRIHYKGLQGNAVFYFVPGPGGSLRRGERWINWACYLPVGESELSEFLVDRHGRQHTSSLPPGAIRPDAEERLKGLMRTHLPDYFSNIVTASKNTFAQPIYTVNVPAYYRSGCCLVGDAGSVAPPFTGSGVFKATNNVVDLVAALAADVPTDQALEKWSQDQLATAERISVLGEQMERAFIWDAPDFSGLSQKEARTWWNNAITFPRDFRYVGEAADDQE
jgi:2-polyprenyl-6-methoxyphenol hydroxylase-like FAD-dependent oxidoreductase